MWSSVGRRRLPCGVLRCPARTDPFAWSCGRRFTDELPVPPDVPASPADATINLRVTHVLNRVRPASVGRDSHVLGRFRVLGEIARGGIGVVLRALDATSTASWRSNSVPDIAPDSDASRRLRPASPAGSTTGHCPVYEARTLPDGRSYFAMPFVRAARWLRGCGRATIRGWTSAAGWAFERVCGPWHAREGVSFRDLKPAQRARQFGQWC